jgi:N-terminal acetyltransferase B complex non-catalytic subunit
LIATWKLLTHKIAQVWKANVLFNHTDETHKNKGIAETLQLCNAEPAISDLDTLDILHRTLQKMDGHNELRSAIWEKAAKAKPQDHALQMRWFTLGFEASDWKTAQKVSPRAVNEIGLRNRYQIADDWIHTSRLL